MSIESDVPTSLGSMFADYFIDYASYVITDRAVPHLNDGLKPVQRRIMHTLYEKDDGRYSKVANLVGHAMQYHPHGDSSIASAMVMLGQKDLLIDTQGNWGNILTGDGAAAPRYIEARLTPFARAIAFNEKTTEWMPSYDGRQKEPVTLPMKFPLLLAQGVEGIAVTIACDILPHNFNELLDACVACLRGEEFELLPDFATGGLMDASDYRDGAQGGKVRVRARIVVEKKNLLKIDQIPYQTTTEKVTESILQAANKGKIKIAKIEDNTAAGVEIMVHLPPGVDAETTRDALFAFTKCEVTLSPNPCVIFEGKPLFLSVSEILRANVNDTRELLRRELEIRLGELSESWHFSSLEKIFIENRIYREIEECETWESVLETIDRELIPYKLLLRREVTRDDLVALTEIRIKRISKFNKFKADEVIQNLEKDMAEVEGHLQNLTRYTIRWFEKLKKQFGAGRERKTEICSFQKVDRRQVATANETLYFDRKGGFVGYSLKKEEAIGKCSTLDDFILFTTDGKMRVMRVAEKVYVGSKIMHLAVLRKEDDLVYSMIYRDGKDGAFLAKRFRLGGITREKEYDLTKGNANSRVFYFGIHATEAESEAQRLEVHLKPALRMKNLIRPFDFAEVGLKGRGSNGNIVTKHQVEKILRSKTEQESEVREISSQGVEPSEEQAEEPTSLSAPDARVQTEVNLFDEE